MFTGGSQFAFIGVLGGGGAGLAAWSAASLLGIRNGLYAVQMKALLKPAPALIPVMAELTIDESMAVGSAQSDPDEQRRGFWSAGLAVYVFWNLATLAGALAGNLIGDPKVWGLDGAAVAAFCGLLAPQLKARNPVVIGILAAVATVIAVPLLPPGVPILIAGAVAVAAHFLLDGRQPA
jgi:predicted branched-subunit amino acid permease